MLLSIRRVCKYRHAGQFNSKNAPRSCAYKVKIFLQVIAIMANFGLMYILSKMDNNQNGTIDAGDIQFIYIFYNMVWSWSIYVMFYEYKKGLPHAWYCHQLFWTLCLISHLIIIIMSTTVDYNELNDEMDLWGL